MARSPAWDVCPLGALQCRGRSWDGKPYSGGVEWIQNQAGVPAEEYASRLKPLFKPKPGFAREWARLAKEMGAQYVVFTSKHHEGFALFDSKVTDFDAKDFTGRDLFKEIVDSPAGRRDQGGSLFFRH